MNSGNEQELFLKQENLGNRALRKLKYVLGMVVHACNPSYTGDWEDLSSRPV
jgi:hypothetical protein